MVNNAPAVSKSDIPGQFETLNKNLARYERRTTKAYENQRLIIDIPGKIVFATGVLLVFTAASTLSIPLLVLSIAIIGIARWRFPNAEHVDLSQEELRSLLASDGDAVQQLIKRYGKACSQTTFKSLTHLNPGIEQAKARMILLKDLKSREWRKRLKAVFEEGKGVWLSSHAMTHPSDYTLLYKEVHEVDDKYDTESDVYKNEAFSKCSDDWKRITRNKMQNVNHKLVLSNVSTLLNSCPTVPYAYLGYCLNANILKICAQKQIKGIMLSKFPWSVKLIKEIINIPTLKSIFYDTDAARPEARLLISIHFNQNQHNMWERK